MSNDSHNIENFAFAKPLIGAALSIIAAALLGVLFMVYEHTSRMAQFMIDHIHAHELEETACAEYRQSMRREMDMIWRHVHQLEEHHDRITDSRP